MKHRIVLVEDDPDILFTVTIILEDAGYEVEALTSARSVIDGNYTCPDLFILDKRMPDMDGLDVCRHLRSTPSSEAIPVVIVSASPKFGPLALKAGANDFLEKPFHVKDLLALVEKYVPVSEERKR
jgi:DNA-binding response OmpR family regulator